MSVASLTAAKLLISVATTVWLGALPSRDVNASYLSNAMNSDLGQGIALMGYGLSLPLGCVLVAARHQMMSQASLALVCSQAARRHHCILNRWSTVHGLLTWASLLGASMWPLRFSGLHHFFTFGFFFNAVCYMMVVLELECLIDPQGLELGRHRNLRTAVVVAMACYMVCYSLVYGSQEARTALQIGLSFVTIWTLLPYMDV